MENKAYKQFVTACTEVPISKRYFYPAIGKEFLGEETASEIVNAFLSILLQVSPNDFEQMLNDYAKKTKYKVLPKK